MTSLLLSPGHQQPYYWLLQTCSCLIRGTISTTFANSVLRNDRKHKNTSLYLLKKQFISSRVSTSRMCQYNVVVHLAYIGAACSGHPATIREHVLCQLVHDAEHNSICSHCVQEDFLQWNINILRHNFSAFAMELRLFCVNFKLSILSPSILIITKI